MRFAVFVVARGWMAILLSIALDTTGGVDRTRHDWRCQSHSTEVVEQALLYAGRESTRICEAAAAGL